MKRPGSIKAICCFYWFNTLVLGPIGVMNFLLLFGPYLAGTFSLDRMFEIDSLVLLACGLSVIVGVFAIFFAIVGWGLWKLKRWARRAAIVGSSLLIAANLLSAVIALAKGKIAIPYALVFHGLVLWALFREDVKAAFEPTPLERVELL